MLPPPGREAAPLLRPEPLDHGATNARLTVEHGWHRESDVRSRLRTTDIDELRVAVISWERAEIISRLLGELAARTEPGRATDPIDSDGTFAQLARQLADDLHLRSRGYVGPQVWDYPAHEPGHGIDVMLRRFDQNKDQNYQEWLRHPVRVDLTPAEAQLIGSALDHWHRPDLWSDSAAKTLGFPDLDAMVPAILEARTLSVDLEGSRGLSPRQWTQLLAVVEIVFASDVLGAGGTWEQDTGMSDHETLDALRSLQRRLPRAPCTPTVRCPSTHRR